MSLPWHTTLTVVLGLGVVGLAIVSVGLWRRVRALSAQVDQARGAESLSVPLPPPSSETGGVAPLAGFAATIPAPRVTGAVRPRPVPAPDPRVEPSPPTLIAVPDLRAEPKPVARTEADPGGAGPFDGRFTEIAARSEAGATVATIAEETGYPVGQIELILGLLRHRAAVTAGADRDDG